MPTTMMIDKKAVCTGDMYSERLLGVALTLVTICERKTVFEASEEREWCIHSSQTFIFSGQAQ